jgi:hypothetical protein
LAFRQAVARVTLEGARQALPADAALIEWFRYEPFDPKAKDDRAKWGVPQPLQSSLSGISSPTSPAVATC